MKNSQLIIICTYNKGNLIISLTFHFCFFDCIYIPYYESLEHISGFFMNFEKKNISESVYMNI